MAKEEKEKKKFNWGWIIVGAIAVAIILIWLFGNSPVPEEETIEPVPVEIEVVEPEVPERTEEEQVKVDKVESFCEEKEGIYDAVAGTCTVRELKGQVFPWIIEGWEAQGMDCDEPSLDEEGEIIRSEMVKCYATEVYTVDDLFG